MKLPSDVWEGVAEQPGRSFFSSYTIIPMNHTTATRTTRLKSRISATNPQVTLFELSATEESSVAGSSRPLKRARLDLEAVTVDTVKDNKYTSSSKLPSPKKQKSFKAALETPHPAPAHWRETYDVIKEMRSKIVAPVDTMGCDTSQLKETDPKNQRFGVLVSLMLSSQTKDEVTDAAVTQLRSSLGGCLSVDSLIAADEAVISGAICKVGFWRRKTQYIKQTAVRLRDEFSSDVPKTVEELCSLPGVGPKMAFLALQSAWKLNHGIGVDTHVHRITNRLGWHKPETKNPEETRVNLESWLPAELRAEINHVLVGFGQTICLPIGPKCGDCKLNSGLCPSAKIVVPKSPIKRKSRGKPAIEIVVEADS